MDREGKNVEETLKKVSWLGFETPASYTAHAPRGISP